MRAVVSHLDWTADTGRKALYEKTTPASAGVTTHKPASDPLLGSKTVHGHLSRAKEY
jgi:hypothetical protein